MSEPRSYAQGYLEAQAKYEAELAAYKDQLAATNRELEGLSARYDAADLERCQLRGECALLKQQLDAERAKVATATKGLRNVLYQGHNLDCLFCGFKDKIATDALAAIQAPRGEQHE